MKWIISLAPAALLSVSLIAFGGGGGGGSSASAAAAPSIATQPSDQKVIVGRPATFTVSATGGAQLVATPQSQSATLFPYPGTAPSVSANGTSTGIVWAHENSNPAVLHAYDAANLAHEIYNSNQAAGNRDLFGAGNKFITPTIADGKVFVGTTNTVAVFGLLH